MPRREIPIKSEEEVTLCRESSLLVGKTLAAVAQILRPGITGLQVDHLAESFIRDHGATPSFKNFNGFPFSVCYSVNEAVVHGFPGSAALKDGDIVTVDIGVFKNGFHGDFAYTFAIGSVKPDTLKLLEVTKACTYLGVAQAINGNYVGDIANAVQKYAETHKFGVVRELVGHGLGKDLHEPPEVPNFGARKTGPRLSTGMVLAIEPMINMGKPGVRVLKDGWTIVTKDGRPSAHFEHNVVVREDRHELLSSYDEIENSIKNNINLTFV
jgi:methionyl aminopeptidase